MLYGVCELETEVVESSRVGSSVRLVVEMQNVLLRVVCCEIHVSEENLDQACSKASACMYKKTHASCASDEQSCGTCYLWSTGCVTYGVRENFGPQLTTNKTSSNF